MRASWVPWVLIGVGGFLWFYQFRSMTFSGGDSELWERVASGGEWMNRRQFLPFLAWQAVFRLTHAVAGYSVRFSFHLVSCAAGAAALLIAWRMFRGRALAWWSWSLVATAGFTALFYGHIESYACSGAALLLHLLAVQRYEERRWPAWTLFATWTLLMVCHLIAFFLLPVMAVVALKGRAARGWTRRDWDVGIGCAIATVWLGLWFAVYWPAHDVFMGPDLEKYAPEWLRDPWLVWSDGRADLKLKYAWWNGGVTGIAALLVAGWMAWEWLRDRPIDRVAGMWAWYFAVLIGFTIIWKPMMDWKDWDLFAFPWIVGVAIVARRLPWLPWKPVLLGLMLGANGYLFLTRVVVFADLDERGFGTIEFIGRLPSREEAIIRIDDRETPQQVMNHYPAGVHTLSVRDGVRRFYRAFYLKDRGKVTIDVREGKWEVREEDRGKGVSTGEGREE